MTANQPQWPREWLMTDERIGDRLWEAIAALPSGAGVVFRHYSLADRERRELGLALAAAALRRKGTAPEKRRYARRHRYAEGMPLRG